MYKLITSSKDNDDLSTGFGRSRNKRRDELALNKNKQGKYHLRIMLKDVFGSAEHQENYIWHRLQINTNKKLRRCCYRQIWVFLPMLE